MYWVVSGPSNSKPSNNVEFQKWLERWQMVIDLRLHREFPSSDVPDSSEQITTDLTPVISHSEKTRDE